uniref:Pyridoxal-dependent decarboxylase domain-containing protein 1 n=1 Tax=Electrophorus electricus TaxID=8005 RepID=A0A4W4FY30_ELEEL
GDISKNKIQLSHTCMDPVLAEMGDHLADRREHTSCKQQRFSWRDIPGPLQGNGQDMVTILQLVQNLMHDEEDKLVHRRMQCVGEQGHMALLGHSLAAYISVLDKDRLRKVTTRILSDTTLWLCRLFRYESGSVYFHDDDREGLLKVCRLIINARYEDYATEGFTMLSFRHPVIYHSAACRPGLGQHLCSQLGLPLSTLCCVPCNTMFGSQHQMDVALLDKLMREDLESGKLPLLLIANAGTPGAGHTDKLGRLKELCVQYNVWLHVEGFNLATLALSPVSSMIMAATKSDSMTLTPGPWLGLPAVPAATLYRHEDPALSLAAGLTSSHPVEKLRALPLWLSLQYLGHDGIVERIRHASQLVRTALRRVRCWERVEDDLSSPVVVFRFSPDSSSGNFFPCYTLCSRGVCVCVCCQLGERLARLVPASGVDVVELEDEGVCVRFNPIMTAAVLGTQEADVMALSERLMELLPSLSCTLRSRQDFREEVFQHAVLSYVEDLNWAGLGALRYEPRRTDLDEGRRHQQMEKINSDLLKKLKELDTDLDFSTGPEFGEERNCVFIGMVPEDIDVAVLVETIASIGRELEESGKLLENMTEVVRKGILEAEEQLRRANEEKLIEEGVLRQIPLVGSVVNWFSPFQSSVKGRTFDLAAGGNGRTVLNQEAACASSRCSPRVSFTGQKAFRRPAMSTDSYSETSSVCHLDESYRDTVPQPPGERVEGDVAEVPQMSPPPKLELEVSEEEASAWTVQRVPEGEEGESPASIR